jgi:hypothetical protein
MDSGTLEAESQLKKINDIIEVETYILAVGDSKFLLIYCRFH